MNKGIFLFIVLMRALAAIMITNAHYTGVYPTDLIANGGLLGDVLFFAVSGFCLANTSSKFSKWYLKRFVRVYIPSWLMTLIYMALGAYMVTGLQDIINFFVWPTHWHFVASIIILYIPLFFVLKYVEMNRKNYWRMAIGLFVLQLALYLTIYDTTYYHIDKVREPMIEFLFFQSMLLGLHYRWRCNNEDVLSKQFSTKLIFGGVLLLAIYFVSKLIFVKYEVLSAYQLLNQIVLWLLLYVWFQIFMGMENKLKVLEGGKIWFCVKFIADRTLEIYLVQYVILDYLKIGPFPLNWLLLTITILGSAICLRWLSQQIIKRVEI
ncbi:acyltransferase family protein [Bacteroides nordii]|uniref:acyltransferase family protein n=1 Tax=Bacteroides nordii TaxID=291645 RepID=UPI003522FFFA